MNRKQRRTLIAIHGHAKAREIIFADVPGVNFSPDEAARMGLADGDLVAIAGNPQPRRVRIALAELKGLSPADIEFMNAAAKELLPTNGS